MKVVLYLIHLPFTWAMISFLALGIICLVIAYKRIDKNNKFRTLILIVDVIYILSILYVIYKMWSANSIGFKMLGS